jgi:ABC-type oligopeptide transport system substrate-binding subunit
MGYLFRSTVLVLVLVVLVVSVFSATTIVQVSAQGAPYVPPYSIYGTPTAPSSVGVLNATGEYWGPYINTIYVTWFTTSEAIIEALVNGYIQYMGGGISNIQQYNQVEQYVKTGEIAVNITPSNSFGYLGFNVHVYPMSNVHFRRAIQHLTNYQSIASALDNGILGIASPYYLYPSVYGQYFSSQEAQAYQKYGSFNLTAAVQELELAGLVDHPAQGYWTYPNGSVVGPLSIYTSSGTGFELRQQVLESITSNAAAINLTINIVPVNFNTFIDNLLPTGNYEMYNLGWSLGAPVSPTWLYYIFGPYVLNTFYQNYDNQTVWSLTTKLLDASSYQALYQYTVESATLLQEDLPYVILDWGVSLTPVNVASWKGYIVEAPYGVLFTANVHPVGQNFGGLYRFGMPQSPDTLNLYEATSLYDFDILGLLYTTPLQVSLSNPVQLFANAAYNYSITTASGVDPNGHYFNGSVITFNFLPNAVWQDGVPMTAVDFNFTLWYLDVGGYSSNPYNPSSDTVTIDPGVTVNYTAEAANPGLEWFGSASSFVDSYVPPNDPYQITLYFNTSSISNILTVYGLPILPEHVFGSIQPTTWATMTQPQYLALEDWSGPYVFNAWSPSSNYAQVTAFQPYYLFNPTSSVVTAQLGSSATYTVHAFVWSTSGFTSTSSGYYESLSAVNGASGEVYVLNPSTLQVLGSYPLSFQGNGTYTATIPTSSLGVGTYTLVAQVNWTGPSYMYFGGGQTSSNKYFLQYMGTLTVVPQQTTSTSTTSTTTSTTTTTTTSSTSSVTTTVSSGFPTALAVVIALIVVALIVLVVGVAMRRGRPTT